MTLLYSLKIESTLFLFTTASSSNQTRPCNNKVTQGALVKSQLCDCYREFKSVFI